MESKTNIFLEDWKRAKSAEARLFGFRQNLGLIVLGASPFLWVYSLVNLSDNDAMTALLLIPGAMAIIALFWVVRYTAPYVEGKAFTSYYLEPLLGLDKHDFKKTAKQSGIDYPVSSKGWSFFAGFPFQHAIVLISILLFCYFAGVDALKYKIISAVLFVIAEVLLAIWYRVIVKRETVLQEYWIKVRGLEEQDGS